MGCLSYLEFLQFIQTWCEKEGCYAEEYCEGVYILKKKWKPKNIYEGSK